ncbi:RimK family protein [Pontiella sp.]|uniref:RimK family protein n=1 Tax=Pontiella sp. TaxID=2837462 RepID=UPI0035673CFE
MSKQYIVVEDLADWTPFFPSENLLTFEDYQQQDPSPDEGVQIINLCRDHEYMGRGYYCSLLAEARGDRVLPSVRTINELSRRQMYSLGLSALDKLVRKKQAHLGKDGSVFALRVFFGTTLVEELRSLARQLFDLFPCPVLEANFQRIGETWAIESVQSIGIHQLEESQQDEFADALDQFSRQVWRRSRRKKRYAYDLAILADPEEKLPPSSKKALESFVLAGRQIGIDTEIISKHDYGRLTEFDALFIRETTAVDHHTYQFAQKAEHLRIPVVDDTNSILKCANKIYLAELLRDNELATPKTLVLYRDKPESLAAAGEELGLPIVLKIPDGSFSKGVYKVNSLAELKARTAELFESSVLVLAQEFMYTDFDWRIGVLGGRPLFACKYFMSKGHWQIYNHAATGSRRSGGFTTMAVEQAPQDAVKLAVKACGLIGKGLYGVDIKQSGNRFAVIEINDNPNIDAGVEDVHLGKLCYLRVMEHFFSEMERYRYGTR